MKSIIKGLLLIPVLLGAGCSSINNYTASSPEVKAAVSTTNTPAPPATCSTTVYRQFDFWIGDWTVSAPDGSYAGKNSITSILNGCALHERWTGRSGYRGDSLNFYDAVKKQWHQTWIDYAGGSLYGDGGLVEGSMVLSGRGMNQQGNAIVNRITWMPNPDGSVRQHWEASSDDGQSWSTVFDGLYKKTQSNN